MKASRGFAFFSLLIVTALLCAMVAFAIYMIRLDNTVRKKFEGKRWEIPAKVYARPLELFNEARITPAELKKELGLLGYKKTTDYQSPGTFVDNGNQLYVHTRGFDFGDSQEPEQVLEINFAPGRTDQPGQIADIRSTQQSTNGIARLEPILVGGIYPRHNEDRVLIQLANVPQHLIDALIATEDRQFYQHRGVSIRGISRAIVSNVTGGTRQGGSTLTQQLVKNFYLSPERTLKRKANEALMAVLIEAHYSKNAILEAYLNEVNLGQNGNHSINGFGLAAQFYFDQPLDELKLPQLAFLVGLVKGPSLYNAWRNPKLALERRNTVLHNMLVMGKISQQQYDEAKKTPLGVISKPKAGRSLFPDFLDVVRRQLKEEYQESDLTGEGLRIFTTLDPLVQTSATQAFERTLNTLIKTSPKRLEGLQGAVTIANPENGELLAVVGGSGLFTGFNRAIDAKRQVGSLLKPIVYFNALQSQRYRLISPISDEPITINGMGMKDWKPKNYDGRSHGIVPLQDALAHSYNLATVRLGWESGIPTFINTLRSVGISEDINPYPSVLLGAVNLSPMEVLGMYQVLAANGFKYAPRSIRSVVDAHGNPLQRYGLSVQQSLDAGTVYLINYALQQVMRSGTGASVYRTLPAHLNLAGKTGTTNDARDSWFAGYSGNYVTVVWLGHDDNRPIGLTGSSGALPVWINIMQQLNLSPVEPVQPSNVQWQWLDSSNGKLSAQGCLGAVYIPLLAGTLPKEVTACGMLHQYDSQQQPYGDTQLDDSGNPVVQPYAKRIPDTSLPAADDPPAITLDLPADEETGRPPVVRRMWSSEF